MGDSAPILLGILLGGGIVLAFYGLKRLRDPELGPGARRAGLWLVNLGVVAALLSMALMIWGG